MPEMILKHIGDLVGSLKVTASVSKDTANEWTK